jgi:hypothetical protein
LVLDWPAGGGVSRMPAARSCLSIQ